MLETRRANFNLPPERQKRLRGAQHPNKPKAAGPIGDSMVSDRQFSFPDSRKQVVWIYQQNQQVRRFGSSQEHSSVVLSGVCTGNEAVFCKYLYVRELLTSLGGSRKGTARQRPLLAGK